MNADYNHDDTEHPSLQQVDANAKAYTNDLHPSRCCQWTTMHLAVGLLSLSTLIAIGVATYFAGQASAVNSAAYQSAVSQFAATPQPSVTSQPSVLQQAANDLSGFQLPTIDASAAVGSDKFSMATGAVGESGEGLFVLDHNSGLLQCAVLYPRMAQFMALFTVNVSEALANGGKGGKYIMATGQMDFPSTSSRPAAPLVVYVLDTSSGNYACYGVPFNRAAVNSGKPQQGGMILLGTGTANPIADRDSGR